METPLLRRTVFDKRTNREQAHGTDEASYLRPEPAYAVQATTNVFSIAFTDLSGDLSATPPENTYANVAPPNRHFYRVVKP